MAQNELVAKTKHPIVWIEAFEKLTSLRFSEVELVEKPIQFSPQSEI
jgi:hypothetical protein